MSASNRRWVRPLQAMWLIIVLVALLYNLSMNVTRFPPTLPGKLTTVIQIVTVSRR